MTLLLNPRAPYKLTYYSCKCIVFVCVFRLFAGVMRVPTSWPVRWWTGSRPERALRRPCSTLVLTRRGRRRPWRATRKSWAWSSKPLLHRSFRYGSWGQSDLIGPGLNRLLTLCHVSPVADLHGDRETKLHAVHDQEQGAVSEEAGWCAGEASAASGTEARRGPDLTALQVATLFPQTRYGPLTPGWPSAGWQWILVHTVWSAPILFCSVLKQQFTSLLPLSLTQHAQSWVLKMCKH